MGRSTAPAVMMVAAPAVALVPLLAVARAHHGGRRIDHGRPRVGNGGGHPGPVHPDRAEEVSCHGRCATQGAQPARHPQAKYVGSYRLLLALTMRLGFWARDRPAGHWSDHATPDSSSLGWFNCLTKKPPPPSGSFHTAPLRRYSADSKVRSTWQHHHSFQIRSSLRFDARRSCCCGRQARGRHSAGAPACAHF
jgi:hypothetical protein